MSYRCKSQLQRTTSTTTGYLVEEGAHLLALQHNGPELGDVQQVLEHLEVLDKDVHLLSGVGLPQLAKEGGDLNKVLPTN